jgi:uracil-DNA glycosylase family 4
MERETAMPEPQSDLQTFHDSIKDCQKCALASGRTQVVCGSGNPQADVMFVGEAPGYYEDRQGVPFVGAAGKLLDRLLQDIGLQRAEVFITNVVKCRPPQNRDPRPEEVEACQPYLYHQIDLIEPRVICTLGNFATQLLLGRKVGITKVRGQYFPVKNFVVFPMLHPAAALHREHFQPSIREDFQRLRAFLDQAPQPSSPHEQMKLL